MSLTLQYLHLWGSSAGGADPTPAPKRKRGWPKGKLRGKRHASEKREITESDLKQYSGDGEGRTPAEASSGGSSQHCPEIKGEKEMKIKKGDSRSKAHKAKQPMAKDVTPQACGKGSGKGNVKANQGPIPLTKAKAKKM